MKPASPPKINPWTRKRNQTKTVKEQPPPGPLQTGYADKLRLESAKGTNLAPTADSSRYGTGGGQIPASREYSRAARLLDSLKSKKTDEQRPPSAKNSGPNPQHHELRQTQVGSSTQVVPKGRETGEPSDAEAEVTTETKNLPTTAWPWQGDWEPSSGVPANVRLGPQIRSTEKCLQCFPETNCPSPTFKNTRETSPTRDPRDFSVLTPPRSESGLKVEEPSASTVMPEHGQTTASTRDHDSELVLNEPMYGSTGTQNNRVHWAAEPVILGRPRGPVVVSSKMDEPGGKPRQAKVSTTELSHEQQRTRELSTDSGDGAKRTTLGAASRAGAK